MRVALLPDLHITSEGMQSLFSWNDSEFSDYLKNLAESVDCIYTLGDTFDLWRSKLLSQRSQRKELHRIIVMYPKTIDFFLNHPKFGGMVIGNHDSAMSKFGKAPFWKQKVSTQFELTNSKSQKIIIQHGHYDFFNKILPIGGHTITWAGAWMERIFLKNSTIYGKIRNVTKSHVFRNQTQVNRLEKMIDSDDAVACLVTGHTHKAEIRHFQYKSKSRLYINAGYFDGRSQDVVILDTETLEITKSPVLSSDYSAVRYIVKTGDVILSLNRNNLFSGAIGEISDGDYSHAFAYIGNQQIIESTTKPKNGVQISSLDRYLDGEHDLCILRLKAQDQVPKFLEVLYSKLGLKYGYRQIIVGLFYFLLRKFFKIDIKRNLTVTSSEVFCSTLIAEGLFRTVKGDVRPEVTSPEMLRQMTDVFDTVYVIRSTVK